MAVPSELIDRQAWPEVRQANFLLFEFGRPLHRQFRDEWIAMTPAFPARREGHSRALV